MKMRPILIFAFVLTVGYSLAQAPLIQKVEPMVTFPNDTIIISGNGFSETESDLQVWFGPVKGTIIESSNLAIEVIVPVGATVSNIEVRNLTTHLSARSREKFMPSFGGNAADFAVSKFSAAGDAESYVLTSPNELYDLCSCDFNNDSKPDVAVTKYIRSDASFTTPTNFTVLRNTSTPGNIDFVTQNFVVNIGTDNAVCGDIDGDGKPDLIVTRAGNRSVHILRNTSTDGGDVNFSIPVSGSPAILFLDQGHFATRMSLYDLNADGKSDLVVTNTLNDLLYVFTNTSVSGSVSFAAPIKLSIQAAGADPSNLLTFEPDIHDFNGDGLPDILIGTYQKPDLFLFANTSSGSLTFAPVERFVLPGSFNRFASYDYNDDGLPDVAITSSSDNKLSVLLNESTGNDFEFSEPIETATSAGPWGVDVSDIDGDGDADLSVSNRASTVNIFTNASRTNPAFTKNDITTALPIRNIKSVDFDGDGKPDLAFTTFQDVTFPKSSTVTVLRNKNCHQPSILNESPLSICADQTIRLQSIPAIHVDYSWTKDGSTVVGANAAFLNITDPGTYVVSTTGEGGTCIKTSSITVTAGFGTVPAEPTITGDLTLCSGQNLTLSTTAVSGATYIWSGPNDGQTFANAPSITINNITGADAGEYTLQIQTQSDGCKSNVAAERVDILNFDEFRITSNASSNLLCDGATVNLNINSLSGHTFVWNKDGAAMAPAETGSSIGATESGSYTVTVTNTDLGCSEETDAVALTFLTPAVASFTAADGCVGGEIAFTNTSTTDASGTAVYSWTFGDTNVSAEENPSHAYASAGMFTANLSISYQGLTGCASNVATDQITIATPVQPVIDNNGVTAVCPGSVTELSIQDGFASVQWNTTPVTTTNTVSVGSGTFTVITEDANGCAGQAEITINEFVVPALTIDADPSDVITERDSTQLIASVSDLVDYNWAPQASLNNDSVTFNPKAGPRENTTYMLTGYTSDGCAVSAEITITVNPAGEFQFPKAFSPNGDNSNDIWQIEAESNPECTLSVYDGRGRKVFEQKGQNWDGRYNGSIVPEGTYYYVYTCPTGTKTGNVLVFK